MSFLYSRVSQSPFMQRLERLEEPMMLVQIDPSAVHSANCCGMPKAIDEMRRLTVAQGMARTIFPLVLLSSIALVAFLHPCRSSKAPSITSWTSVRTSPLSAKLTTFSRYSLLGRRETHAYRGPQIQPFMKRITWAGVLKYVIGPPMVFTSVLSPTIVTYAPFLCRIRSC